MIEFLIVWTCLLAVCVCGLATLLVILKHREQYRCLYLGLFLYLAGWFGIIGMLSYRSWVLVHRLDTEERRTP